MTSGQKEGEFETEEVFCSISFDTASWNPCSDRTLDKMPSKPSVS
jgi:hypothetical protein